MRKLIYSAISIFALLNLVACGGGSDSSDDSGDPSENVVSEGLWQGTTDSGWNTEALLLDDGSYYVFYGNGGIYVEGVIVGTYSTNGDQVTSSDATDFYVGGGSILSASISGTIIEKQSFNGTVDYGDDSTDFISSYNTDYELTPSLSDLAGNYSGQVAFSLGSEMANISISKQGNISGTGQSGCSISGTATPRANGNVFDLSFSFGGEPCYLSHQTLKGIVYYHQASNIIYAAALNDEKDDGVLFISDKD